MAKSSYTNANTVAMVRIMCGRYSLHSSPQKLAENFSANLSYSFSPLYNIAPTLTIAALISVDHQRLIVPFRWGLIPSWHKEGTPLLLLINAKSETIDTKPSFRKAFRQRRCLILADGFYEWHVKQPYYVHMKNNKSFGMAGIWERWVTQEKSIDSCCIITIPANEMLSNIHDRMPAIITPDHYDEWLDSSLHKVTKLKRLLDPVPDQLEAYRVSTSVNKAKNENADLIRPI